MEFQEAKNWIVERATKLGACSSEKQRVIDSSSFEEICQVIKDNVGWFSKNRLFSETKIGDVIPMEKLVASGIISGTENTGLCNSGDWNSGDWNSGDWNSGDWNSGNRNSGDWNSGNRNSGDWNSGDWNSGDWNSGNRNSGNRNSGNRNSGDWNSGNRNSGNWNSGDWNSGNCNSGNRNSGDWNSGDWNSGNWNLGDWNSGNSNSGDWNSGNRNSGDCNSGNRNLGDCNSGDWNSGNRNSGLFNRDTPKLRIFEMESDWSISDWRNSSACYVSRKMILTQWITESEMTDQEKIDFPEFYTAGGYLKKYQFKEACLNWWSILSRDEKDSFKELPNWNQAIFEEITGVDFLE